jgi:hypothetical protein
MPTKMIAAIDSPGAARQIWRSKIVADCSRYF